MKMRVFYLSNSDGDVYTLTASNKYTGFLTLVDGLGYERSPEYRQVGDKYEELTDNINQGVITGVIQFFQPFAYQKYTSFALFCQSKNLTLVYRTPTGEFMREGSVTKIEKSEGTDSLKVKIEFTSTSLWYQTITETVAGASLTLEVLSAIESPCCMSFTGITKTNETLSWSQKLNNVTIMSGALNNVTIAATDTVYVRTDTNPYQIYKVSNGTKTDLYAKSDFSTKRFPLIYKGTNNFIVTGASALTVEGKISYETV